MTLAEFEAEFRANVVYEAIYDDTEGRRIVVIRMMELYALMNDMKEQERQWVGLTWYDMPNEWVGNIPFMEGAKWAEAKLKEKNT